MNKNKKDNINHLSKDQLLDIINIQRLWIDKLVDCVNVISDDDVDERYFDIARLIIERVEHEETDLDKLLNNKIKINTFINTHSNLNSIPSFDSIEDDDGIDEYGAGESDFIDDDEDEFLDDEDDFMDDEY